MQTKTYQCLLVISVFSCFYGFKTPSTHETASGWRNGHFAPTERSSVLLSERFKVFHEHFKRPYRNGSREYQRRYEAFQVNLKRSDVLNKLRRHISSAQYGITKFSDMTHEEFKAKYLSGLSGRNGTHLLKQMKDSSHNGPNLLAAHKLFTNSALKKMSQSKSIPSSMDWRNYGKVTDIRDQKSCGACWAFSVVEAIESMAAITSGKLVPLSVQEVIDCSNTYDHSLWGCKGGDTGRALDWLKQTKTRLVPSSDYPLTDKSQNCNLDDPTAHGVAVTSYNSSNLVAHEDLIQQYVSKVGPVSVSVDATSWHNYLGGIIQYHCGENPNNHAVLIVGYDKTGDIPYYIVKNSWGNDFGDDGYMYIAMGGNVCGIADEVSTVAVDV